MFYSESIELFASVHNLSQTVVIMIWKTLGLAWLPFGLAEALDRVMAEDGTYPRHSRNEAEYNLFFLFLYGIFGTFAQVASYYLVRNRQSVIAKTVFGLFHVSIAIYHNLVVFDVLKPKTLLFEQNPEGQVANSIIMVLELVMALQFLLSPYSPSMKTCLDLLSFVNLVPFAFFIPMSHFGIDNKILEKAVTAGFFVLSPLVLFFMEWTGQLLGTKKNNKEKTR